MIFRRYSQKKVHRKSALFGAAVKPQPIEPVDLSSRQVTLKHAGFLNRGLTYHQEFFRDLEPEFRSVLIYLT